MIEYRTGKPDATGVYACRRVEDNGLLGDIFLIWHDGKWGYLGSDQRCRYEIVGWVGPLRRKLPGPTQSQPQSKCSVCGEDQLSTPSGITCSKGHGGADPAEEVDLFA